MQSVARGNTTGNTHQLALLPPEPHAEQMQGTGDPTTPIGDRIGTLLDQIGQNPSWLADRAGVSRSTISRILKAQRNPTPETLKEIAPVLGVELGQLGAGTDAAERVTAAEQLVARADYEAAVKHVIEFERQAHDLRAQLRDLTEERDNVREREREAKRNLIAAEQARDEALREARRFEHDAFRYRSALEKAVADLAQLQAEVSRLGSAVEASRATGRVGAILAGVAAVVSVASYLGSSDDDFDDEVDE